MLNGRNATGVTSGFTQHRLKKSGGYWRKEQRKMAMWRSLIFDKLPFFSTFVILNLQKSKSFAA